MDTPSNEVKLQNLRRVIAERDHVTQKYLAKALGLTQPAISQYLNGRLKLNTDFIMGVCRALKVNPIEIDPTLQWEGFNNEPRARHEDY